MEGKTGVRKIPISLQMAEELRALANERGEIWYDERGRLDGEQLAHRFRDHAERAGITGPQIGPHTLRRTFAGRWANSSGGAWHLQEILGHSDLQTTQIYTDVVPLEVKRAHAQFSPAARMGLFGEPGTPPRGMAYTAFRPRLPSCRPRRMYGSRWSSITWPGSRALSVRRDVVR